MAVRARAGLMFYPLNHIILLLCLFVVYVFASKKYWNLITK